MAHLPRRSSVCAAAFVLTLTAAACSGSDESDESAPETSETPSAPAETSPSESGSPSPSRTPKSASPPSSENASEEASEAPRESATEPTPTGLPTPGEGEPSPSLVQKVLSPEELPGLNDRTVWSEKSTGTEGDQPFGDCQQSSLSDIGASDVVVRTYDAHGSQAGAQLIAKFPDAKTAWRAHEVLKSWRNDCRKQLDAPVKKVGPMIDLQTDRGKAQSYLVQFGQKNADEHNFHGVGITRVGSTISLVTIDVLGQDYNYIQGEEPAALAAAAAASKL